MTLGADVIAPEALQREWQQYSAFTIVKLTQIPTGDTN